MDFNFQVHDEEEAEESVSGDEADPGVFFDTPSSVPLSGEAEIPVEACSSPSLAGASPSDLLMSKKIIEFIVHFSYIYYNVIACFYAEICIIYQIYSRNENSSKDQK